MYSTTSVPVVTDKENIDLFANIVYWSKGYKAGDYIGIALF